MFDAIRDALHRELDGLDEKYSSGTVQMNRQDLEHIDTMAHALKNLATYEAMTGSYGRSRERTRYEGYSNDDGYRRRY